MENSPLKELMIDSEEISLPDKAYKNQTLPNAIRKKRQPCKGDPKDVDAEESAEKDLPISAELDRWIRQRGRDLRLRLADRQHAVKLVNDLKKDLLKFLKENEEQPFFRDVSVLNSGSYYELVKINKANEFDIMLKLNTPRIQYGELMKYDGLFYTISLCRPPRGEIRAFLLEDGLTISASKIIKEMHCLVRKFISKHQVYAGKGHWVVCRKRVNSPAVTLAFLEDGDKENELLSVDIVPALEVPQGWPKAARAGPVVDNWLGKNARRKIVAKPVYFVPKRPRQRNLCDTEKESWRISFSHIEKEMIRFHGNKKTCCEGKPNECCRKLCLRLLKCLLEGLKHKYPKELDPLCSYHGKTAFFHHLSARFEDSLWTPGQLSTCFMKLLVDFHHAVQVGSLPHFFVPDHNLFSRSSFPKHSLQVLSDALREQIDSGLPLLQVPKPAPAICYATAAQLQPQQTFLKPDTLTPETCDMSCKTQSFFHMSIICVSCVIFLVVGALYAKM
ncbi:cyclic GMP-AMP synthase [Trichomycterus rosablanca]|uniref:cyclic GMP-AMP synthase n=1 Tax=Trichomycterus rosablanca TaxID=2290929 RepID=UPI002F35470B